MTFGEFLDYEYGQELRNADDWNRARHIMWASMASMGGNKTPQPTELVPLWIDKLKKKKKPKKEEYLPDDVVKKWIDSLENG